MLVLDVGAPLVDQQLNCRMERMCGHGALKQEAFMKTSKLVALYVSLAAGISGGVWMGDWCCNPCYWRVLLYMCGDIEKNPGPLSRRCLETPQAKWARLEAEKVATAARRSQETPNEKSARRAADKVATTARRSQETPEEKSGRLKRVKVSTTARRSQATPEEKSARLKRVRVSTTARRSEETPVEKSARLKRVKVSTTERRSQETPVEKYARRHADKVATTARRSQETPEEKSARLKRVKVATTARRSQEIPVEKSARLKRVKVSTTERRSQKTPVEKYARRHADKVATTARRSQETPEEKSARLKRVKVATTARRSQEIPVEKSARLKRVKVSTTERRSQETPEDKYARRHADKVATTARRSQETPEEKSARLKRVKVSTTARRSQETPEEKSARLKRVKDVVKAKRQAELLENSLQRLEDDKVQTWIQRQIRDVVEKDVVAMRRKSSEAAIKRRGSVCSRGGTTASTASSTISSDDRDFDVIGSNFGDPARRFHDAMINIKFQECCVCKERVMNGKMRGDICNMCSRDKHDVRSFSDGNAMDPLAVPLELQGLTQVEELLIAQVRPMMTVYRLPFGQLSYRGNVINFPWDVKSFAKSLPPKVSDLDIVIVRRTDSSGSIQDLRVRREVVRTALLWLKVNNVYYDDIVIDDTNIEALPADDVIPMDSLDVVYEPDSFLVDSVQNPSADVLPSGDAHNAVNRQASENVAVGGCNTLRGLPSEEADMGASFVPQQFSSRTERQRAHDALKQMACDDILQFPSVDFGNPINEFTTAGYVARAFPALLPHGQADLKAPRLRHVTPLQYFRHTMNYCDGRFARHPRFRYFALNSVLRWPALSIGNAYVKQNPGDKMITLQELKDMNRKEKEVLAKTILRIGYALPGTRSFWMSKRKELMAMIEPLGKLPTVFFTLSAAGLHWPDLHALLPGYTSKSQAVIENPMLCAWFFQYRVRELLGTVFTEFGLEDYWGRFEFQHRGSIHFHGLAWLAGAPDVSKLSPDDAEGLHAAVSYFDGLVTAWNPVLDNYSTVEAYRIGQNPTSLALHHVEDIEKDYRDLIVVCQRHTVCSSQTCLKKKGGTLKCRFDYPKPLRGSSAIEVPEDGDSPVQLLFTPRRNDPRINVHNRLILQVHRANVDMQPIVDKHKVVSYLTKYVSKSEVSSSGLASVISALLERMTEVTPATRVAQRLLMKRLLMKTVGERDYSAQETSHLLMDYLMTLQSRQVVHLSLRGERRLNIDECEENVTAATEVDKYMQRPSEFNDVSLLAFTRQYSRTSKGSIVSRKRDAVVLCHPQLRCDKNSPHFEDACRFHLMKHRPFRQLVDLKGGLDSFADAYAAFVAQVSLLDSLDLTELMCDYDDDGALASSDADDADCPPVNTDLPGVQEDWMLISRALDEASSLPRDDCDWTLSYRQNPDYCTAKEFYDSRMQMISTDDREQIDCSALNPGQKFVFEIIKQHLLSLRQHGFYPLRLVVCGTAGTGKSFLIKCLKDYLRSACSVMAPTGVAALAIEGATIHSALRIPVGSTFGPLKGDALKELQSDFNDVHFVVIDEMSMIGHLFFGKIDQRLRQARPGSANVWFGGFSVVLIGDFGQLPPVCDKSLFCLPSSAGLRVSGALAYRSFSMAVSLQKVVRQERDEDFRLLLLRLRNGAMSFADYSLMSSRFKGKAHLDESFNNCVHLFPTVKLVAEHNFEQLNLTSSPIAKVEAEHNCAKATSASTDAAGGLAGVFFLCKGSRIMLTANLHVSMGLCNGTQGTVVDIVYQTNGPPSLPTFVLCRFNDYKGCCFLGMHGCFPVFPIQRHFEVDGVHCSRRAIPLMLAYSMTVHKAQGLTLDKCVVDIGCKEFTPGLTFVALSRVRRLSDLLLVPFAFERLTRFSKAPSLVARIKEDSRLAALSKQTFGSPAALKHVASEDGQDGTSLVTALDVTDCGSVIPHRVTMTGPSAQASTSSDCRVVPVLPIPGCFGVG